MSGANLETSMFRSPEQQPVNSHRTKQSLPRKVFKFGLLFLLCGMGVVLVDAALGNTLSHAVFDKGMAIPLALYVALNIACLWALAGRSNEDLKRFGWFGHNLDPNHRELKIGNLVRALCGFMGLIFTAVAVGQVAAFFVGYHTGNATKIQSETFIFWTVYVGCFLACFCGGSFFGYIAVFGRIPRLNRRLPWNSKLL